MITQYFFLCLIHNTWWMVLTEWWNHILFFPCGSRCGSLPYLLHAIFFSDNKTNDSFTEFSMWFIIIAMTYLTNINNLILLRFSRERLGVFPFSLFIYKLLLKFSSKLCPLHICSRQLYLHQLWGGIDNTWEPRSKSPFWCVLEVKLCICISTLEN